MIVAKLQGGLGNQIFQWAFGRNLAKANNVPLYLDTNFYNLNLPGITKRSFSLSKLPNLKFEIFENVKDNGKSFIRFNEPPFFTQLNYDSSFNYYLDGYFQCEKYFIESEDLIRNELAPSEEILKNLMAIEGIEGNNISLHVRRTDYITSNGFHPVQSIDYYQNAIDIIGDYDNVFIFSDDIDWCKKNLNFKNMIFVEGNDDIIDIWIMSLCKNNIIANSSFSWWGAWLNKNKNKKVIAPKLWFGSQNEHNIIPDSWIVI